MACDKQKEKDFTIKINRNSSFYIIRHLVKFAAHKNVPPETDSLHPKYAIDRHCLLTESLSWPRNVVVFEWNSEKYHSMRVWIENDLPRISLVGYEKIRVVENPRNVFLCVLFLRSMFMLVFTAILKCFISSYYEYIICNSANSTAIETIIRNK